MREPLTGALQPQQVVYIQSSKGYLVAGEEL